MANRTMKYARTVKGTNPQYLVEKIIRTRVYDSRYWKEECFALNAEILVDKAMALDHIGGIYGGSIKPTPFLCLILKMLQIQPTKDIVVEFIKNADYKYVRLLGAFYMRLTGNSLDCYNYLEPLYNDYRKIKRKKSDGSVEVIHVDEYIDELLRDERSCDVILPRIQKREVLEETGEIDPRVSALDDDLSDVEDEEEEDESDEDGDNQSSPDYHRSHHRRRSHSPSPSRHRRSPSPRSRRRSPSPQKRRRSRSRSPIHHRRRRSPSPSGHRDRHSRRSHGVRDSDRSPSPRRHTKSDKSEKKSKSKTTKVTEVDEEIRQANELRKSLGIKPLRTD